jgi:glycosyltransferase involved in cell wall biosynthesis
MRKLRVAIVLRYGLSSSVWRARHAAGEVVDETPYGYHLAAPDVSLTWSVDHAESALGGRWRRLVSHVLGFDLVHVWRNRKIIQSADAVWTHTEREHLGVALLRWLAPRRYRAHSIAQTVWLWDSWRHHSGARKALYRRLLRQHDVEIVLSRVNRDISQQAVPGRLVARIPFGTHLADPAAARATRTGAPRVLVVGNDRHRDWRLMADVASLVPEAHFDIITLAEYPRTLAWSSNAEIRSISQSEILHGAYAEASVVAIPLHANNHASGCTVAIEGVSAGLPVVATDTGGIDEYLDDATATLVPVGDSQAFASALRAHLDAGTRAADPSVALRRGLSQHDYVARLVAVTRAIVEGRALDPAAETFAPMPRPRTSTNERQDS